MTKHTIETHNYNTPKMSWLVIILLSVWCLFPPFPSVLSAFTISFIPFCHYPRTPSCCFPYQSHLSHLFDVFFPSVSGLFGVNLILVIIISNNNKWWDLPHCVIDFVPLYSFLTHFSCSQPAILMTLTWLHLLVLACPSILARPSAKPVCPRVLCCMLCRARAP